MSEKDVVWPWGMTDQDPDPAARPWVFNPRGFLLVVLEDDAEAQRAGESLDGVGFSESERRIHPGAQVIEERERFLAQRSTAQRLVEKVTIDNEVLHLLLDYARAGRAFMWVHVPERADANRAIRGLSANNVLYFRYYGDAGVEEIRMP
ncbi:MAG TPA: hypothetical protein VNT52_14765 [Acidimicrobiales bacterium]|jgi:hypothetical protein|nr:hypothetical protein [Acidimicrobiales bacterium]